MLTIVAGPMFAGKTTWILNYVEKLQKGSFRLFKPNIDTRYSQNQCVSHNGLKHEAENLSAKNPRFPEFGRSIQTIIIDELNFFEQEKLESEIKKLLLQGKTVVGAGLLYDFQKQPFGATLPLSKMADKFIELSAVCDKCQAPAANSYRKAGGGGQFLLGAEDKYGACCDQCYPLLTHSS